MHNNFIELVERVEKLANDELKRANKEHPLFHSLHEGYAVLLEEFDEAETSYLHERNEKSIVWEKIKDDLKCDAVEHTRTMKRHFKEAAAEMIQCIAMCQKIIESEKSHE